MEPVIEKRKEEMFIYGPEMAGLISAVHDKGAVFRFKAPGSSMRLSIRDKDILTLSPLHGMAPLPGEVAAFRRPRTNRLILHRVIKKKGKSFFFRGDSQHHIDANIPQENIIGVVTQVERSGRKLFRPTGFANPN
ncbi:S24/S26 family peptidase [Acidobacteriota bacterium]